MTVPRTLWVSKVTTSIEAQSASTAINSAPTKEKYRACSNSPIIGLL